MEKYLFICPHCGTARGIQSYSLNPNELLAEMLPQFPNCTFCKITPIISTDLSDTEYKERYKNLTGLEINNDATLIAFIEKCYTDDHPEQFDPAARENAIKHLDIIAEMDRKKAEDMKKPHCPKCHSTSISTQKRGFKLGRAIATTALTGFIDVGAVAGVAGSGKMINVCQKCGYKWKIGG